MPTVTRATKKPRTEVVGETAETHIIFGITFDLNGKLIPISAGDVLNWKKEGVKLKLPEAVEVGSIEEALKYLEGWLGITMPDPSGLPTFIKEIVEGITSMVITVYQAEVEIPGEKAADQENKYLLEVGGLSEKGIPIIPNTKALMIKGLVVGATNKKVAATPSTIQ